MPKKSSLPAKKVVKKVSAKSKKSSVTKKVTPKTVVKKTKSVGKVVKKSVRTKAKTAAVQESAESTEKREKVTKGLKLIIVESPTKAKTIKKYLGRGHDVIASNGHIKDLPKSKLGVNVDQNFEAEIDIIAGKKAVVDKLLKHAKVADQIFIATDPDREGEAIAFHIAEVIGKKAHVHRVLFNAITKKAVQEALENPTTLNQQMYDSQKTRRILDRLVGYKISPLLWDKIQRGLSAGRVQSVALRLIVQRDEEIKNFTPEQWFSIAATFSKQKKTFESLYYGTSPSESVELVDATVTNAIVSDLQGKKFTVVDVKKRERRQNPTPPFTTSKLQQEAANKLNFSSKKTMMLAQRLYEGVDLRDFGTQGLITYMRTDSVRTEPDALNQVREYISKKYGNSALPSEATIYKKRGAHKVQDAHEAIRPANLEFEPYLVKNDLDPDEYKLYEMIWNKFISSQMIPAVIDQTTVFLQAGAHVFKTTGSIIKVAGFRTIYLESLMEKQQSKSSDDEENGEHLLNSMNEDRELPPLEIGESFTPIAPPTAQEHWTAPPPRYSDGSIVKELEEQGIGRPSTYATIISNITDRGYVEKRENRYMPTELGNVVSQMLVTSFPDVMDVAFTAKIEDRLDDIEDGSVAWTKVLKDFWKPFSKTLERAQKEMKDLKKTEIPTGIQCPKCQQGEYMVKWGRNGQFMACSRYPECTSTEDFIKHLSGAYEIVPKEFAKDPCPTCKKRLIIRKGRYGRFLSCEDYPQCKTTLPYTIDVVCPECKRGKFAEKRGRYNKVFYGCSSYPDCTNAMWDLPRAFSCPHCNHPVMGERLSKRLGQHLQCPKCKKVVPIDQTPFGQST